VKVTIEFITDHFLELEYNLPFIGHFKFYWSDPIHVSYGVVNDETGAVIKKGFHTYQEAEHWALEETFSIV
jgi:hypothetical protein